MAVTYIYDNDSKTLSIDWKSLPNNITGINFYGDSGHLFTVQRGFGPYVIESSLKIIPFVDYVTT